MLHSAKFWLRCALCGVVFFSGGCARRDDAEKSFTVRGVVRGGFDPAERTITIEHEAIPGYMPAMTMPFYTSAADTTGLTPGERVEFEFRVGAESRATNFRKLGRVAAGSVGHEASRAPAGARSPRLREGDRVSDFRLVDQDNRAFSATNLQGRYSIVTFIFTRCPVPEFCPLIARKFQTLQSGLRAAAGLPVSEVQLLSITIDPEHDRPEVLREYGTSLGADFARWRFLTGDADEVANLTRMFAVRAERNNASIDHTLATALIGPNREVVEIWRGNAWQAEEILTRLREVTARN